MCSNITLLHSFVLSFLQCCSILCVSICVIGLTWFESSVRSIKLNKWMPIMATYTGVKCCIKVGYTVFTLEDFTVLTKFI